MYQPEQLSDEQLQQEWPYLTRQQVQEYKEAFKIFDRRRTGTFTTEDLRYVMQTLGQKPSQADLESCLRDLDADGDGIIDFAEFLVMMLQMMNQGDPERELKEVFSVFDKSGNGTITVDELRSAIKSMGEDLSDADMEDALALADRSGNGVIDYQEFIQFVMAEDRQAPAAGAAARASTSSGQAQPRAGQGQGVLSAPEPSSRSAAAGGSGDFAIAAQYGPGGGGNGPPPAGEVHIGMPLEEDGLSPHNKLAVKDRVGAVTQNREPT